MKRGTTIDRLKECVSYLSCEIGPRSYHDCKKLDLAAEYIAGRLGEYGYSVSDQLFPYRGKTYRNIIGKSPAADRTRETIVVGAHYDTVTGSPGADDNASAVAGLLEIARLMSQESLHPEAHAAKDNASGWRHLPCIDFVAFGLEEPPVFRTHNMGSYHYARSLKKSGRKVRGMICLEMIGYFTDSPHSQKFPVPFMERKFPSRGNFVAAVGNLRSGQFTETIKQGFEKGTDIPIFSLNALSLVLGIDFSDHWSFYKFGYPAVMITDTAFYRNPNYHTPDDTHDTLDYQRMAKVVYGVKSALEDQSTRG